MRQDRERYKAAGTHGIKREEERGEHLASRRNQRLTQMDDHFPARGVRVGRLGGGILHRTKVRSTSMGVSEKGGSIQRERWERISKQAVSYQMNCPKLS